MIDNSASPDPHPTQIGINGSLARERDSERVGSGEEQRWRHFGGRTSRSFAISMTRRVERDRERRRGSPGSQVESMESNEALTPEVVLFSSITNQH